MEHSEPKSSESAVLSQYSDTTIATRFDTPTEYSRIEQDDASFGNYLRTLPLKPVNSIVKHFDGSEKRKKNVYMAVVDLEIGKRDLHQCADAVMRLRAEYLYGQKKYEEIHFNFTNGFKAEYSKWKKGNRISVNGNSVKWTSNGSEDSSYKSFWKYLEMVFSYAGTASLSKELNKKDLKNLQIGDVFIQGGFPGHAIIVVDLCEHKTTGKKMFMLAQSYMPAQEIQILMNPNAPNSSPWYSLEEGETLVTPEWTFNTSDLKSF